MIETATGATQVELASLLAESDTVVVLTPLTPDTTGLLGEPELALVKPGAMLVNTARGAVVDEQAMLAALRTGHLAGAGIDVHSDEPLPGDHPLLNLATVTVTPHLGGSTLECDLELVDALIAALAQG